MNNYTKLFIQNQEIDLLADSEGGVVLPLNITKRANNLQGEVAGDFTKASVTVLATKNNIAVLGEGRGLFDFRIENDGVPSYFGTATIRKIPLTSQGYESIQDAYVLNLLGNNASWFKRLGGVKLSELTDTVITYDAVNVHAGFLAGTFNSRTWAFGLIKYKEWASSTGSGDTLRYQPSIYESTPMIQQREQLIQGFASIGYIMESVFFDTDFGRRLVLPMPIPEKMPAAYNQKYVNMKAHVNAGSFNADIFSRFDFNIVDYQPASTPYVGGLYTAPLSGYYHIRTSFAFPVLVPAPVAPYALTVFFQVAGAAVTDIAISWAAGNVTKPYPSGETVTISTVAFLNQGDEVEVVFQTTLGTFIAVDYAELVIEGEVSLTPGMPLDFKYLLRDWKWTSNLLSLKAQYNLMFESDDARRIVRVEPKDPYVITDRVAGTTTKYEGFYKDSDQKNYSQLIDRSKKGETQILDVEGEFFFKYQNDGEKTIEFVEGVNDLKLYESSFKMTNGSDNNRSKTIEVPFVAKTIHVSDFLARFGNSIVAPQFMLKYPKDTNYINDPTATENTDEYMPMTAYHAGQRVGFENKDGTMEEAEFPGLEVLVPMTFMVNYNDDTGLDPNLGFNNVTIQGNEVIGLTQKFYLQDLARQNQGELTSHYVPFNSIDEHNFSHRTKGFFNGKRYIVQLITAYNPITGNNPEFKFLLDAYPNSTDIDNIENNDIEAVVTLKK